MRSRVRSAPKARAAAANAGSRPVEEAQKTQIEFIVGRWWFVAPRPTTNDERTTSRRHRHRRAQLRGPGQNREAARERRGDEVPLQVARNGEPERARFARRFEDHLPEPLVGGAEAASINAAVAIDIDQAAVPGVARRRRDP